jgi:hypothetical protein
MRMIADGVSARLEGEEPWADAENAMPVVNRSKLALARARQASAVTPSPTHQSGQRRDRV